MTAYVMAHVHSTNFGPEIIDYLRRVDAFDGLPAGYLAKSALEHALSDAE